jgi:uncharacterized repeat protein (TIGR03987 family)
MSAILIIAIVSMFSALGLYTIGVWAERIAGRLNTWHLILFWFGLTFDTLGTALMGRMSGKFEFDFHGITGALAIIFMLGHAIWASIVLLKNQEKLKINFHKFSLAVWTGWLIPFVTGLAGAMMR